MPFRIVCSRLGGVLRLSRLFVFSSIGMRDTLGTESDGSRFNVNLLLNFRGDGLVGVDGVDFASFFLTGESVESPPAFGSFLRNVLFFAESTASMMTEKSCLKSFWEVKFFSTCRSKRGDYCENFQLDFLTEKS